MREDRHYSPYQCNKFSAENPEILFVKTQSPTTDHKDGARPPAPDRCIGHFQKVAGDTGA